MSPSVMYTPHTKSLREETVDIITFTRFKEGGLLYETHNDAEGGDKSNDNSINPQLIIEEEIDAKDSGDESDNNPIYTEMLEDICDRSQYHPNVNRREAHYKIRDRFNQRQSEFTGSLKDMYNMVRGSQKVYKIVVKDIYQYLPPFGESGSDDSYFIPEPRNFAEVTKKIR